MARTYRRKGGNQRRKSYPRWRYQDEDPKKFNAMWHADGYRFYACRGTPSAWTNAFMTRPQRAEVRRLTHKVMRLIDLEDTPLFPLAKKPHQYYW